MSVGDGYSSAEEPKSDEKIGETEGCGFVVVSDEDVVRVLAPTLGEGLVVVYLVVRSGGVRLGSTRRRTHLLVVLELSRRHEVVFVARSGVLVTVW